MGISAGVRYEVQNKIEDYNNVAPRLGLVFTPFRSKNIIFRFGFGLFYGWLDADQLVQLKNRQNTVVSSFGIGVPTRSLFVFDPNAQTPQFISGSSGFEYAKGNFQLRANYTFQKGTHIFRTRIKEPRSSVSDMQTENLHLVESSATTLNNRLELGFAGKIAKQILFRVNYRLSKTLSDSDEMLQLPSDSSNLKRDWGYSDFDQRLNLYSSISRMPSKNSQFSIFHFLGSPLPYSIVTGLDENSDYSFTDRSFGVPRHGERGMFENRVDFAASFVVSFLKRKKESEGLSIVSISAAEQGTIFMSKDPNSTFGVKFFLRIKNLLNTTTFTKYNGIESAPNFREPYATRNAREMKFGIRLSF
ncbi:MAG: hypothetical protein ACK5NT_03630 [Pyrinomonadaceae bacterium]